MQRPALATTTPSPSPAGWRPLPLPPAARRCVACCCSGSGRQPPTGAAVTAASATAGSGAGARRWRQPPQRRGSGARRGGGGVAVHATGGGGGGGGGDYGDAFENLFRSKVFRSEVVVKEFDEVMAALRSLSAMAARFPEFDLTGKELFLDQMAAQCERYRLFIKRLELVDDPAAREYLRATNAQMLEGGFTMQQMFMGLSQSLEQYRRYVEEERRVSSDPAKHQAWLASFKEAWSRSALGAIDMQRLMGLASPAAVARAQKSPDFYRMIREVSEDPSSRRLQAWIDHPDCGPLAAAMWKAREAPPPPPPPQG